MKELLIVLIIILIVYLILLLRLVQKRLDRDQSADIYDGIEGFDSHA